MRRVKRSTKNREMPLKQGDLASFGKIGKESGKVDRYGANPDQEPNSVGPDLGLHFYHYVTSYTSI